MKIQEKELLQSSDHPLFYRLMKLWKLDSGNEERYLNPISVGRSTLNGLRKLIFPQKVQQFFQRVGEIESFKMSEKELDLLFYKGILTMSLVEGARNTLNGWTEAVSDYQTREEKIELDFIRCLAESKRSGVKGEMALENLKNGLNSFKKFFNYSNRQDQALVDSRKTLSELLNGEKTLSLEEVERTKRQFNEWISLPKTGDRIRRKAKQMLKTIEATEAASPLKRHIRENKDLEMILKSFLWTISSDRMSGLYSLYDTKVERGKRLMEVDDRLALTYLGFTPLSIGAIGSLTEKDRIQLSEFDISEWKSSKTAFTGFWKVDLALYESMVDNFQVVGEDRRKPIEVSLKRDPYSQLARTMIDVEETKYFSKDMQARIDYFVKDMKELKVPQDQVDLLCENFKQFELSDKAKKLSLKLRRECKKAEYLGDKKSIEKYKRMRDIKIRNFIDDITLKYLRKGEVPGLSDIEGLYQNA